MRLLLPFTFLLGFFTLPSAGSDLQIYFIDTGQSDATLLISPTGQTFLFDGGDNGDGNADVVPLLNSLGISSLDYVGVSHYHADHLGGLDEVWNAGIQATVALDRGFNNLPTTQSYSSYASAYSSVRQTAFPGQVINLGGGVTLTCIVREGDLLGGGSVNISGSSQWENSSSIGWLVEYGDFDMWMGGDLTGGGNGTTNVESSVAPLVGDIEVYQVNHHGSRTSSNSTWVNTLDPAISIVPCGSSNPYGYPKEEVLDRLNSPSSVSPVWCTTDGVGTEGFVDTGGNIVVCTDGNTYTATMEDGTELRFQVDEQTTAGANAGELVVAEYLADAGVVSDSDGEYFEIAGMRQTNVSLDGITVAGVSGESFTIGSPILLNEGEEITIAADGLRGRNGGHRPHLMWPTGSFALGNGSDTVELKRGGISLDRIDYNSSWPDSTGVAAERKDLAGSGTSSNFAAAVNTFGNGDKGTPGETNTADTTNYGGGIGGPLDINILTPPVVGQTLSLDFLAPGESGALYQGMITLGTVPGYSYGGALIPARQDRAWTVTTGLPGWSGTVPVNEVINVNVTIPNNPSLRNMIIYAVFYTYDNIGTPQVRLVSPPELMVIS